MKNTQAQLELIRAAYEEIMEEDFDFLDISPNYFGFISKTEMCKLMCEDPDDDDIWIIYLKGWDYEHHNGTEVFRPTSLRGKITENE